MATFDDRKEDDILEYNCMLCRIKLCHRLIYSAVDSAVMWDLYRLASQLTRMVDVAFFL